MTITAQRLRSSSIHYRERVYKSHDDAKRSGQRTAFLCHSHLDAELVKGLISLMQQSGWNVYVDWADTSMPSTPDRETASKIKDRIKSANFFLFLATRNSTASRWCPWEIGYADGVKNIDTIIVIPTVDDNGTHHGNEYLQLYRRVDATTTNTFGVYTPGKGFTYLKDI